MTAKTPVTVLQELMVKFSTIPQFDFLDSGIAGMFHCRVKVLNISAVGKGRSKKDAKHDVARIALEKLAEIGKYFPNATHDLTPLSLKSSEESNVLVNHVGALKDLCSELNMPNPEYDCIGETGFAHCKQFTIKCKTASLERSATAPSKKQAKQLVAEKIFIYLNENMHKRIAEAAEQESLSAQNLRESNEIALNKYYEKSEIAWKPNLAQRVGDYHLSFPQSIEEELIRKAISKLNSPIYTEPIKLVEEVLEIMQLDYNWSLIQAENCSYSMLKIINVNPPLFITVPEEDNPESGKTKTATEAVNYMKLIFSY